MVVKKGSLAVLENGDHIRVLEEVGFGPELESIVCRLRPHVVLVDEAIPQIDVYSSIPQLRKQTPNTHFIVYVDNNTPAQIERCLASGIDGLLVKVPSFTDTIKRRLPGGSWCAVFPSHAEATGDGSFFSGAFDSPFNG